MSKSKVSYVFGFPFTNTEGNKVTPSVTAVLCGYVALSSGMNLTLLVWGGSIITLVGIDLGPFDVDPSLGENSPFMHIPLSLFWRACASEKDK